MLITWFVITMYGVNKEKGSFWKKIYPASPRHLAYFL